jgi:hypothetical protein
MPTDFRVERTHSAGRAGIVRAEKALVEADVRKALW